MRDGMKQVLGFWLPETEEHLGQIMASGPVVGGGPTYQYHKYKEALRHVRQRSLAVDVGAHCGLWSRVMALDFESVAAFEPVDLHRRCFRLNVRRSNVVLFPYALGERAGSVALHTGESSSGDTYVQEGGEHAAEMRTIDDMCSGVSVSMLKIDCEGYEYNVLVGGERVIRDSRPVIVVEQKPGRAQKFGLKETQAVDLLKSWGAVLHKEMSGDFIMGWKQ